MGIVDRIDRFQRRHPVLGFPIAVLYKFIDDQGIYLAALITYYGFLSLFPLLLLLTSIVGFLFEDNREDIINSALSQFPIIREALQDPQGLQGSTAAVIVGGLIAVYGALGVANSVQNAMNTAWAVPRHRRPNPFKVRLNSVLLIVTGGLAVSATTVLSGIASAPDAYALELSDGVRVAAGGAAVLLNTIVAVIGFRVATARSLRKRDVLPGAIIAAVVWQLLQVFGTAYVTNVVKGASTTYGTFNAVIGLIAWIFFAAVSLVFAVELNVVRAKRLYPRALLTVFTDRVDLTEADKRVYADAAAAQRLKGFERIIVSYEHEGQYLSSRRAADAAVAEEFAAANTAAGLGIEAPERPEGPERPGRPDDEAADTERQPELTRRIRRVPLPPPEPPELSR